MDVKKICIDEKTSIKVALKTLDETAQKILLVTNDMVLQGVITDGDIRRWILKNGDLSNPVVKIMNTDPIFLYESDRMNFRKIMKNKKLEAIPILDKDKKIKDIIFWNDNFKEKYKSGNKISNKVVIMAGGKGDRLKPFTNVFPKPLIPIGKKPIVERIINRFNRSGCNNFYLTINYKSEMIKAYFKDKDCKYKINYIEEDKPLGTAGALFFLKNKINATFFLSNCDIIIKGDYYKMLKYHKEKGNVITIITSMRYTKIPYGVMNLKDDGTIKNLVEKPEYSQLVNTGMYILEPEILKDIPENQFYHITDLIDDYLEKGKKIGTYPVSEKSWLDMGEIDKMENMINELEI